MSDAGSELVEELMRFRPDGLTANAWAVKAGVSRTIWADLKRHGNPSRRTLEKLMDAAGSSLAEFEALRIGTDAIWLSEQGDGLAEKAALYRGAELPPLPLIASHMSASQGEAMRIFPGEVIGRVARPMSLAVDGRAYAVTMVGNTMWPRFRPGRRIAVSPTAPIQEGDDVLVVLHRGSSESGRLVVVRELVRKTPDSICLRQFTPDRTDELAIDEIAAVEKVLGELI